MTSQPKYKVGDRLVDYGEGWTAIIVDVKPRHYDIHLFDNGKDQGVLRSHSILTFDSEEWYPETKLHKALK